MLLVRVLWRVVWRDMFCCYSPPGVLERCRWLVCRLDGLVMYEQVIVGTLVARCLLCLLCVVLDAMLQLCVRRELHVAHCGLCIGCIASYDAVEF